MQVKAKFNVNWQLLDESIHSGLTPGVIYTVAGICDGYFRLINDYGEPILYPEGLLEVVEPNIPADWVREDFPDGEYYIDPPDIGERGFYEDYFDGKPLAVERFERCRLQKGWPSARKRLT